MPDVPCNGSRVCGVAATVVITTGIVMAYVWQLIVLEFKDGHTVLPAVSIALIVPSLVMLLICFARVVTEHPGHPPDYLSTAYMRGCVRDLQLEWFAKASRQPPLVLRDVGSFFPSLRECVYCNTWKSDTTHHCSSCHTCIVEMDHHCPWVGQCVGEGNHKFFLLFLLYANVSAVVIFATCLPRVIEHGGVDSPGSLAVCIVAGTITLVIGPFFVDSFFNVANETSTISQIAEETVAPAQCS